MLALAGSAHAQAPGELPAQPDPATPHVAVAIDPIGPAFRYYEGGVSVALSQRLALTASGAIWNRDHGGGYQLTLGVPYYFEHTFSGPFIETGVILRTLTWPADLAGCSNCDGLDPDNSYTWAGPEVLVGWDAKLGAGFHVVAAVGVAKPLYMSYVMEKPAADPDINGYFRLGYAF
jgi:hypothetical protein